MPSVDSGTLGCVDDERLLKIFQKYCSFGQRHGASQELFGSPASRRSSGASIHGATSALTIPMMDGSKWAKLAREAGLIDNKKVDLTEIDIIFNRVKDRNERKISFLQFRTALRLVGEKRYNVDTVDQTLTGDEAETAICEIVHKLDGPQITAGSTKPESSPIIDRLMEAPPNYISKTPKDDVKSWKDGLRSSLPSSPASRKSSVIGMEPNLHEKSPSKHVA